MESKKLFVLGTIFVILNVAVSLPNISSEIRDKENVSGSLKMQCKSVCLEAKGNAKFDDDSLMCYCEIAKNTPDMVTSLLMKKAKEIGIKVEVRKGNQNAKREMTVENIDNLLDIMDETVVGQISNTTNKETNGDKHDISQPKSSSLAPDASSPEEVIGQGAPNTVPRRQKLAVSNTEKDSNVVQPPASSKPKAPLAINKKFTFSDSSAKKDVKYEKELPEATKPKPPTAVNINISRNSSRADDLVAATPHVFEELLGESEPLGEPKRTTRRSTPSPRKSSSRRKLYNPEYARRILESARQHIDNLIVRTHQTTFNPALIGPEIEAVCTSLKTLSNRATETAARNVERSSIMEQIREREKERHARIHSRFGGHADIPRRHKPLLVGASNPNKVEQPLGKITEQKETESQGKGGKQTEVVQKEAKIITQPPELVEK